jgi:hypothetical protein
MTKVRFGGIQKSSRMVSVVREVADAVHRCVPVISRCVLILTEQPPKLRPGGGCSGKRGTQRASTAMNCSSPGKKLL